MTRRAAALAHRQRLLLVRSSELRGQFAHHARAWQPPLALADQVHAGWRWLRAHPEVPLAAAAVLVLLRPRRAGRLAWRLTWRLWTGWRLWQRLQPRLAPLQVLTRRR